MPLSLTLTPGPLTRTLTLTVLYSNSLAPLRQPDIQRRSIGVLADAQDSDILLRGVTSPRGQPN